MFKFCSSLSLTPFDRLLSSVKASRRGQSPSRAVTSRVLRSAPVECSLLSKTRRQIVRNVRVLSRQVLASRGIMTTTKKELWKCFSKRKSLSYCKTVPREGLLVFTNSETLFKEGVNLSFQRGSKLCNEWQALPSSDIGLPVVTSLQPLHLLWRHNYIQIKIQLQIQ